MIDNGPMTETGRMLIVPGYLTIVWQLLVTGYTTLLIPLVSYHTSCHELIEGFQKEVGYETM